MPTDPHTLVAEMEALQVRLRSSVVIQQGEPITMTFDDGQTYAGTTGDVTQTRNPDGPAAADAIDTLLAMLKAQREALEPTEDMIWAGIEVLEKADDDMQNYVSGVTTDWDYGMEAEAVWKAMEAVRRAALEGKQPSPKQEEGL